MTRFTDSPFERMMTQKPEGRKKTSRPPYLVKPFFLENQGFFDILSINISEERAIGMGISLYLVRK